MCFVLNAAVVFHHHYLYTELSEEQWVPVLVGKLSVICLQRLALQRMEIILIEMETIFHLNCLEYLIMTFFIVKNGLLQISRCWQPKTLCPHLKFQIFRRHRQNHGE